MSFLRAFFLFAVCVASAVPAAAHEVRPTYLQLEQVSPDEFAVLWKIPARGDAVLRLDLELPEGCVPVTPQQFVRDSAALVKRWKIKCTDGLAGESIHIPGLETTAVEMIARIDWLDRPSQNVRLTGGTNHFDVAERTSVWDAAESYLPFGISHIWEGIDHLLFLVALVFLIGSVRQLLLAVTSFTIAHSLTLGLAVLGVVGVPSGLVETLIALSIVFVAAEAMRGEGAPKTLARRYPWVVAFAFGLFHGLGFAGALSEAGLPEDAILSALLFFNIGVEIGQVIFVAALLAAFWSVRVAGEHAQQAMRRAALYVAGIAGAFWTFERAASLFGVIAA